MAALGALPDAEAALAERAAEARALRHRLGLPEGERAPGALAAAALGWLRATPAPLVALPLDDWVEAREPVNLPGVPGGTGLPGVYGRSLWILKGRPEAEQEAAWKFVKWLLEPEQQAEWFAGSGYLPVRVSAYDLPAAQSAIDEYPLFSLPVDLFLETPSTQESLGPLLGPMRDVREVVATAMEETVVGSRDPIEAIDAAAAEANEIIEDYNRRLGE